MKAELEEKINSLSMIEQNMHQLGTHRQNLQNQLVEIDSSLEELNDSSEAYRIIGNIMVKTDTKKLKEDLDSKKKIIGVKIGSIEKQEAKLQEKAKALQQELVKEIEKNDTK